ncbi:hypothetical protein G7075_20070 [Phycicoccus sp. HDW14]|uniref:phage tail tube protein n=1 Tax=Phycicoccus sp. HDW14 TaxID=2714941 RepID=UPI00140A703B|nr:hypothetical protein [Phycicoccus sp. HDW14]QIM22891.1 hypothetical protein G7075_20070 [Phycicoccus sp. HDW14]
MYYVVAVSTNTFQVSATPGGTKVDISADGSANYTVVADWVRVRAINSLKPTVDNKMEDDSDFDSDGWTRDEDGMGWALELGLLRKIGVTTKAPTPVRRSSATPPTSSGRLGRRGRWFDRNGGVDAYQGFASASWEPDGGGTTDLDKVSAKLSGQGKRNKITTPTRRPPDRGLPDERGGGGLFGWSLPRPHRVCGDAQPISRTAEGAPPCPSSPRSTAPSTTTWSCRSRSRGSTSRRSTPSRRCRPRPACSRSG